MFNGLCRSPLSPLAMPFSHLQWEYIVQTWRTELFSSSFNSVPEEKETRRKTCHQTWGGVKCLQKPISEHPLSCVNRRVPLTPIYGTLTTLATWVSAKPLIPEKGGTLYYGNNSLITRDLVEWQNPFWAGSTGIMVVSSLKERSLPLYCVYANLGQASWHREVRVVLRQRSTEPLFFFIVL